MNTLALAQKEVMANLGRNIVMFQALESTMKHLVPLFSAAGVVNPEGFGERHAKALKKTLGQLLGEFLDKLNSDNREFAEHYAALVEQRNLLVHHFGEVYGTDFATEQGCERIVRRLKLQFEQASVLHRSLRGLLSAMLAFVCEATFAGTDEYSEMRTLCERLLAQVHPDTLSELAMGSAEPESGTTA